MPDEAKVDFSMFLDDYLSDAKEGFQEVNQALLALEKDHSQTERLHQIFRVVHTLKSSSAMLEFFSIAELAHSCEDFLARLRAKELAVAQQSIDLLFEVIDTLEAMVREHAGKKGQPGVDWGPRKAELEQRIKEMTDRGAQAGTDGAENSAVPHPKSATATPAVEKIETVKVHVDLLDALFNLAGELIIAKNRIDNIVSDSAAKELKAAMAAMDRLIRELQDNVSAARLVPAAETFQRFPRMVHDLAREAHKEVELIIEGGEIELDKAVLDDIGEPLLHLLRNAVGHGIEPAETRQEQNKGSRGAITLAAKRTENHISIEVEDDGGGIDIAHIRDMAVRKGFVTAEEAESLPDKDALNLLFAPGFSTADEVTGASGRGVGLDVVRTSARKLGGTVEVATKKGQGTRFTLRLPLSTAVVQTLMIGIGKHVFAIPSDIVLETLEVKSEDIKEVRDEQVLVLRNQVIPYIKLGTVLNIPCEEEPKAVTAVIIYKGDMFIGLGVDTVLDQMENIVKPFDPVAQEFKGFSGGTILGNGSVALLLDIPSLLDFGTLQEEDYAA